MSTIWQSRYKRTIQHVSLCSFEAETGRCGVCVVLYSAVYGIRETRVCPLSYLHITGAIEAAGQASDVDWQPSVSAKHKISGFAVTWDAEHLYFVPASTGVQDGPFIERRALCTIPFAGSSPTY